MLENSTKSTSFILLSSSNLPASSPARTRNVVSVVYIAGIAFMIGIFLLLLWVNLFSRHCWCWHDTSVVNRVNRKWLIRRSITENNDGSSSKTQPKQRSSNADELE